MTLPRGFKAKAEREARKLRENAGITRSASLDLKAIADNLGVRIISADDLVEIERLEEIECIQAYAFSACTFEINGRHVIVYNPLRTRPRRRSDIAHELAHIILDHDLTEIQYLNDIPFRTCQPDQEEEATAFGGTLLLPRPTLLIEARCGATIKQIAKKFGVTTQMAQFRWNTTGVQKQVAAETARNTRQA
ncbi:MAG: ImmA/IrrE family metallo-endopeptidase [Acidimicrobiaceae bacterium]|nr:ImmA/IrrE family metallo-endopeptidase [Acidimicrobiaceae bacterium]